MKLFTLKETRIWGLASIIVILLAIIGTMLWQKYSDENVIAKLHGSKKITREITSPGGFGKWRGKMGFTPEQETALKELRDDFRDVSENIFKSLRANQEQIFEEMEKDDPDIKKLNHLADETGQLYARMRKETIQHMLAIKAVTTPEQYEKMAEMMQQWMFPRQIEHGRHRQYRQQRTGAGDDCD